jgi:hypothetical protein
MYPYCPDCGLKYAREAGYFLGAMYISYGMALVVIAVATAVLWFALGLTFIRAVLWGFVLFLPTAPLIAVWSRVLWIHFDQAVDPARD